MLSSVLHSEPAIQVDIESHKKERLALSRSDTACAEEVADLGCVAGGKVMATEKMWSVPDCFVSATL